MAAWQTRSQLLQPRRPLEWVCSPPKRYFRSFPRYHGLRCCAHRGMEFRLPYARRKPFVKNSCTTMSLVFGGFVFLLSFAIELLGDIYIGFIILLFLIPPTYIVCRLFLVVQVFRCLCFLPLSVYIATWATNVPHVT